MLRLTMDALNAVDETIATSMYMLHLYLSSTGRHLNNRTTKIVEIIHCCRSIIMYLMHAMKKYIVILLCI